MRHNYPALSPLDFERLCADLLGAEFGTRFETFGAGRDGGIDLRYHADDGVVIGQAMHYEDRAALIRTMRKEKHKIAQIRPARYLPLTSCALTPTNKDTLLVILAVYCGSSGDIYGRDELVKRKVSRQLIESAEEMKRLALGGLRSIQKVPELVKSFFRQPEYRYILNDSIYRKFSTNFPVCNVMNLRGA